MKGMEMQAAARNTLLQFLRSFHVYVMISCTLNPACYLMFSPCAMLGISCKLNLAMLPD